MGSRAFRCGPIGRMRVLPVATHVEGVDVAYSSTYSGTYTGYGRVEEDDYGSAKRKV